MFCHDGSKKEGTNIDKVQACRTRGQFLSYGPVIVNSERMPTGELVETYQYQKERGSAVRALMHGVLDVSTCGVWEVVGTPIEACIDEKVTFLLKSTMMSKKLLKKLNWSRCYHLASGFKPLANPITNELQHHECKRYFSRK
ncbi:MAG: hypothetical protein HWD61_04280 [Parachlamydiaceae bacterium]|nr:MAG: hypothetical protein HWD61_04280 [Parachlamydiaceae bacterium]